MMKLMYAYKVPMGSIVTKPGLKKQYRVEDIQCDRVLLRHGDEPAVTVTPTELLSYVERRSNGTRPDKG